MFQWMSEVAISSEDLNKESSQYRKMSGNELNEKDLRRKIRVKE
jgi:hypothetical protein